MSTPITTQTALLVMDYQVGIANKLPVIDELVAKVNETTAAARLAGLKVIFAKVGFQEGYPEIGPNTMPFFQQVKEKNMLSGEQSRLLPQLNVQPGDSVIDKKRYGAFAGSNLSLVLQSHGIQNLVLAGVRTAGVVLSTLRFAADADYRVTVLSDCCADPEPELHQILIEKIFPMQAEVKTSAEWIQGLQ